MKIACEKCNKIMDSYFSDKYKKIRMAGDEVAICNDCYDKLLSWMYDRNMIDNDFELNINPEALAEIIVKVRDYNENRSQWMCPFQEHVGHRVKCKDNCKECWKEYFEQLSTK